MQNSESYSRLFTQAEEVLTSIWELYDVYTKVPTQYAIQAVILGWTPSNIIYRNGTQQLINLDSCTQHTWDQIATLYTNTVKFCDTYSQKVVTQLQRD